MKLTLSREDFIQPLQTVIGVVEKKHTMPILSNVLFECDEHTLTLTATDLEIELVSKINIEGAENVTPGKHTLPGRKLLDILKSLPENSKVSLSLESNNRTIVQSGKSRFTLSGLSAEDFPEVDSLLDGIEINCAQNKLLDLLKKTAFSMAHQDVRYFLNGLLLELKDNTMRAVATDGHRLALSEFPFESEPESHSQVIIPRKTVLELIRLLQETDNQIKIQFGKNHIRFELNDLIFTSKLLDGRYPDYRRVIPPEGSNIMLVDKSLLKGALSRTAILSNEKYRGVRLQFRPEQLTLSANNPEHEEAEDVIGVNYTGDEFDIGFNVSYLLDAINALGDGEVKVTFTKQNPSALIREAGKSDALYVVMPIRL